MARPNNWGFCTREFCRKRGTRDFGINLPFQKYKKSILKIQGPLLTLSRLKLRDYLFHRIENFEIILIFPFRKFSQNYLILTGEHAGSPKVKRSQKVEM